MDVKPYTDSIRRRAEAWAAQCEAARRTARQDAEKLASFLTAKGATKVVLFGSLAREKDFTPDSDIDLATEGISRDRARGMRRIPATGGENQD